MKITNRKFSALQKQTREKRERMRKQNEQLQTKQASIAVATAELKKEIAKGKGASRSRINSLKKQQSRLQKDVTSARSTIGQLETDISGIIDQLLFSTDPRDQVAMLDDSYPVFLMPVRVETRFMTIKHIARVDSSKLSTDIRPPLTVIDGRPVEQAQPYAVRDLFENVEEIPVIDDAYELWIRIFPDDLAVHTHETQLTDSEIEAAKAFWNHIWYAGPDEGLQIGAWRGLVGGRGPERAAWIAKQMTPTNSADQPTDTIDPETSLPIEPSFPAVGSKEQSWSQAPHSRVMPDRFVVRLYSGGNNYREVVGEAVPDPLQLGIDPQAAEVEIESENGALVMKDKIKWLQDFEEAEKVGMGIRVPLGIFDRQLGFSKILVLGVKTSADKDEGKALLEELLENHHHTHGGLSVLPQGTPTNNTEDAKSGYTAYNTDEEDLFKIELGEDLFTPTTNDQEKTDGQHLADALGISYDTVQHLRHADQSDIKEAMCMNKALWPTTFGYYLPQMMHPIFTESDISRTKSHFNKYVLGRGRVPAIRIDDQPYGILPTTAFSKWTNNSNSAQSKFLDRMYNNILKNMESTWDSLVSQVKSADPSANQGNVEKFFLDTIGLHASSVEYYQRYVTGPYLLWNLHNYSSVIKGTFTNPTNASYASSLDFFQLFGSQNYLYIYPPRLFDFFYSREHKFLDGPVVDPLGLSETRGLKAIGSNEENYIDWLIKSNWNQIKSENYSNIGAPEGIPPNSLLYLMLRHSTLLEYTRSGLQILVEKGVATDMVFLDTEFQNLQFKEGVNVEFNNLVKAQLSFKEGVKMDKQLEKKVEKEFERRAAAGELSAKDLRTVQRERASFKDELRAKAAPKVAAKVAAVAGDIIKQLEFTPNRNDLLFEQNNFLDGLSVADYITADLLKPKAEQQFTDVQELVTALECLKGLPTARLERCFAEHIDLANYRLDAWFYSLVLERLQQLRGSGSTRKEGGYIGSYAWLEDVVKGSFEGIHYREVDITPERILIPGYKEVAFSPELGINTTINTIPSWEYKISLTLDTIPPTPVVPFSQLEKRVKAAPGDAAAIEQAIIPTGGNTLSITEVVDTALVGRPFILDNPKIPDFGPSYHYLGRQDAGDITYDFITDKFIHLPRTDNSNQGYIHAPSINHATTAAVLRAGYETHQQNAAPTDNKLAININSERVRRAMYYIEGMNNGQELGALLGYQFERGLHDHGIEHDPNNPQLNLDAYILDIRLKYPLVSGQVTNTSGTTNIETAEAYNVVNGLELVENSQNPSSDYPYGVTGLPGSGVKKNAIIEEVEKLHDALDGINDLLMSEAMHQVVLGNYPKASAVLKAMSGEGLAIDPEVIKTPRTFNILNHRFGLHFDLSSNGHQIWTSNGTPRSIAEPHLNRWLAGVLPDVANLQVNYQYQFLAFDGTPGSIYTDRLGLSDLEIEPIDLYYIMTQPSESGNAVELLNRINYYVRKDVVNADNVEVEVAFADRNGLTATQITLFELQGLMDQLYQVVGNSRPLRPKDFLLSTGSETIVEDNPTKGLDTSLLLARLQDTFGENLSNGGRGMSGVILDLSSEIVSIETALAASSLSSTPNALSGIRDALTNSAFFAAQNAIPPTGSEDTTAAAEALLEMATRVLIELEERQAEVQDLLTDLAAATSEEAKVRLLDEAARKLFGRPFKVYPEYQLYNESQVDAAYNYTDYLDFAGPQALPEWFQGLSPVRKRMHAYHQTGLLSEALKGSDALFDFSLTQLPLEPVDDTDNPETRWVGVQFPEDYALPDENVSFVFQNPASYSASGLQAGILVDEWVEEIPDKIAHTGISVNYNNPNSEPPQVCLLAVSPNLDGKWAWDDLMDTLSETLDWAKKRAVDPDLLNDSIYAQVLPALYAGVSASDDTPTLDFGRNVVEKPNNGIVGLIKVQDYYPIPFLNTNFFTE